MRVTIPKEANELERKIYEIMNSNGGTNSIHDQHRKAVVINTLFENMVRGEEEELPEILTAEDVELHKEIHAILKAYGERHKEEWGQWTFPENVFFTVQIEEVGDEG